jgi:hypothetical protein
MGFPGVLLVFNEKTQKTIEKQHFFVRQIRFYWFSSCFIGFSMNKPTTAMMLEAAPSTNFHTQS